MSGIPSDIAGSALQAGYAQREAARAAEAARTGGAQASERQIRAADEAAGNVETTDDDAQIYSDSEGTGGQGRADEEDAGNEAESDALSSESSDEPDGPAHLDVQA